MSERVRVDGEKQAESIDERDSSRSLATHSTALETRQAHCGWTQLGGERIMSAAELQGKPFTPSQSSFP